MTQIGIPGMGGAMENWGLVTYGENALTYNPATSPFTQLDQVAGIVAHEYAHQWFGNLIGPKWWEFLWLNEGFATLYSEYGTNLVYPEWRMNDYFLVNTVHSVLVNDAYESTRPMNYYVESQAEVGRLFDFVAYSKCKLIRYYNWFVKKSMIYYF
jgi:aminopeptidase N